MRASSIALLDYFASCSTLHQSIVNENNRIHKENAEKWSTLSEEAQDNLVNESYSVPCTVESYSEDEWGSSVRTIIEHGREIRESMQSATKVLKSLPVAPVPVSSLDSPLSEFNPTIRVFGDGTSDNGERVTPAKQRRQTMGSKLKRPSISNPVPLRESDDGVTSSTPSARASNLMRSQSDSADNVLSFSSGAEDTKTSASSSSPRLISRMRQRSRTADGLQRPGQGASAVDILAGMGKELPPEARYSVIMGSINTELAAKCAENANEGRKLRGKKTQRSRSSVGTSNESGATVNVKVSPNTFRRSALAKMTPRMFRSTKRTKDPAQEVVEVLANADHASRIDGHDSLEMKVSMVSHAPSQPHTTEQSITLPKSSDSTTDNDDVNSHPINNSEESAANDAIVITVSRTPENVESCNSNRVKKLNVCDASPSSTSSSTDSPGMSCISTVEGVTADGSSSDSGSGVILSPTHGESSTDIALSIPKTTGVEITPKTVSDGDDTIKAFARRSITFDNLDRNLESHSPTRNSIDITDSPLVSPLLLKKFDTSHCNQRTTVLLDELDRSLDCLSPTSRMSMFGDRSDEDDQDGYDA